MKEARPKAALNLFDIRALAIYKRRDNNLKTQHMAGIVYGGIVRMPKNHRVELRLNGQDYQLLNERAGYFGVTRTRAVETLVRMAVPMRIYGGYEVGTRGRHRLSIRFTNGMSVHGFLWSRGGQLLGPTVVASGRRTRIVDGTPEFWRRVHEFCAANLTNAEDESQSTQPEVLQEL